MSGGLFVNSRNEIQDCKDESKVTGFIRVIAELLREGSQVRISAD